MAKKVWQSRPRGSWNWEDRPGEPERWDLQTEYRLLKDGVETWRSPHVNGYRERS
jgi:hypothetical protein